MSRYLALMLVLTCLPGKVIAQDDADLAAILSEAVAEYHEGRLNSANSRLIDAYKKHGLSVDPASRRVFLSNLLDLCISSYDFDCVAAHIQAIIDAREAEEPYGWLLEQEFDNQIGYYIGQYILMSGDREQMSQWLDVYYEQVEEISPGTVTYVRRQIAAATMFFVLDRLQEAQHALNKALAMIVALENPSLQRWNIAVWLTTILDLTTVIDPEQAYAIYAAAGNFIAQSLPENGPDYLMFRMVEVRLLTHFGDIAGAGAAIDMALPLLRKSEWADYMKDWSISAVSTQRIINCIFLSSPDCIGDAISSHPLINVIDERAVEGSLKSAQELQYLSARTLAELALKRITPIELEALLAVPPSYIEDEEERAQNDIFRIAGLIAGQRQRNEHPDPAMAVELGRLIIKNSNRQFNKVPGSFPLIGLIDKVVIAVSMAGIREIEDPTGEIAELALQLTELYNRQIRQADVESLLALSFSENQNHQRDIQSWQRLSSKFKRLFIDELARVVKLSDDQFSNITPTVELESGSGFDPNIYDDGLRRTFAQYSAAIDAYAKRANIVTTLDEVNSLPALASLQNTLRSNEAFISMYVLGENLTLVCVKNDDVVLARSTYDSQQTEIDVRLVNSALTALHPPSELLDAQYPVASATRLYDILIRPVEQCLTGVSHLIWAPDNRIAALPIGTLLADEPRRSETGYLLSEAKWLVNQLAVSNVLSAQAFIASRSVASRGYRTDGFLGVGNPELGGLTEDGSSQQDTVLRGAIGRSDNRLSLLPPLPDTEEELENIAALFGDAATILVGDHASEASFRAQQLDRYRYISFATHGLIREEIEGLAEAALVLSPRSNEDSLDDGLLKASEIADMRINASLVALSACNTANYDYQYFGAEVSGLAAAFSIAGVPATLATLWPVDSQSSRDVVSGTFAALNSDAMRGPAEALAISQRDFISDPPTVAHAHPRFWAPFSLLGDGGRIEINDNDSIIDASHLTKSGGEIEKIAVDQHFGAIYARGLGEPVDDRFQSVLARQAADGAWTKIIPLLGSGRGMVLLDDAIVIDGYMGGGSSPGEATVVWFTHNGDETRRKSFPKEDYDTFPVGLSKLQNNDLLQATVARQISTPSDGRSSIILRRLSNTGDILAEEDIAFPWAESSFAGRLHNVIGTGYVTIVDPWRGLSDGESRVFWDEYDELSGCLKTARSYLISFDPHSLEIYRRIDTSPYEFNDIETGLNGRVIGVGARYRGCLNDAKLVVADLSDVLNDSADARIRVLYEEDSVEGSQARALVVRNDIYWVLGDVERRTGFVVQTGFVKSNYDTSVRIQFSPGRIREGILLGINPEGKVIHREQVGAAADVLIYSAEALGDALVIGGQIASQAVIATVRLPTE